MSLNPLSIAISGFGAGALAIALSGFVVTEEAPSGGFGFKPGPQRVAVAAIDREDDEELLLLLAVALQIVQQ